MYWQMEYEMRKAFRWNFHSLKNGFLNEEFVIKLMRSS